MREVYNQVHYSLNIFILSEIQLINFSQTGGGGGWLMREVGI